MTEPVDARIWRGILKSGSAAGEPALFWQAILERNDGKVFVEIMARGERAEANLKAVSESLKCK